MHDGVFKIDCALGRDSEGSLDELGVPSAWRVWDSGCGVQWKFDCCRRPFTSAVRPLFALSGWSSFLPLPVNYSLG